MYGSRRHFLKGFDWSLIIAGLTAGVLGVLMISSATKNSPGLEGYAVKQAQFLIIGLILALICTALDYRLMVGAGLIFYGVGLAALLVVDIIGASVYGGQRWLDIAGFRFQPSEFMKILLAIALAQYLGSKVQSKWRFSYLLVSGLIAVLPIALVYAQPDLGTSLILIVIWASIVFIAGVSLKEVALILLVVLAVSPLIWLNLQDYMRDRMMAFLKPESDPDTQYIVQQALISIGSGGLWGKGYAAGSQSQLHFLRVRHTDFIFSVVGEELGFIGAAGTVLLLAFICYRMFRIGQTASDGSGRLLCCGIAIIIAFQAMVNIGMNAGILPVTGVPLPFISQGGSALMAQLIGIGLVESVALRRNVADF